MAAQAPRFVALIFGPLDLMSEFDIGERRPMDQGRQRLDKWLWFARVAKTRTVAAQLVSDGYVRLNGRRIDAPARAIQAGDVLTIALERQVRVLKVMDPGLRRGPFAEACLLYQDLAPASASLEPKPATD